MKRLALAAAFLCSSACGPGIKGGPTMNNKMIKGDEITPEYDSAVISKEILAREPVANEDEVKHILIGWAQLESSYQGAMDPRAQKRTKADAETEVKSLLDQLAAGADFDVLMKAKSEDSSSARSGTTMPVSPDAGLVIEFKQLALRLNVGEYGVCQSDYGFHIIKRYK